MVGISHITDRIHQITTIPSFVNELSRHVSIHKVIMHPLLLCVAVYLIIGLMGAASFQLSDSSDIVATLFASHQSKVYKTLRVPRLIEIL
jgi:hypothetical protein